MDVEGGKMVEKVNKQGGDHAMEDEEGNTVDWRGRPSDFSKHGGMKAAVFVLGLQAMEITAIAAVGNNLITYVINEMHFPLSKSANIVTNFIGTVFLLSLAGGYLSDSNFGSFWTMLLFGFVELSGFILLSVQAHVPQLKPPKCNMLEDHCEEAKGVKAAIFYVALYLVALGSGCVKPNMIAHGADQFNNHLHSKHLSTYFNAAYFAFSLGELVALTVLVWVQTHSGMDVGLGMSAAAMAVGLFCLVAGTPLYRNKRPQGSILTPIAQVFVAAFLKRKEACPSNEKMLHGTQYNADTLIHTQRFRFLDKACISTEDDHQADSQTSQWRVCTVTQVQQVKILISVLPIFGCTIIFNTILAQLQTFSVQQATQMNTHLTHTITIPPASLQSLPYFLLLFLVPLYDHLLVPFFRRFTRLDSGISPLHRIAAGLFLSSLSMVSAAVVEKHRHDSSLTGKTLGVFFLTPQYLIFGVSEMLTAVGLIEFFYKQSLVLNNGVQMQSFLTALTYCSYSFGFYLSSVLVSLVNKITSLSSVSSGGWLGENDLNKDRLDLFYWLLAGLSLLNSFHYLFWSRWFSYNPSVKTIAATAS